MIDVDALLERFNALEPEEQQAIDAAITPEAGAALLKMAPELEPLLRPLMEDDQQQQGISASGGGLMGPGGY